jgi:SnoaL-like domain
VAAARACTKARYEHEEGDMAKSKLKSKSKPKSKPVTIAGLKRAIEGRKASALAGFYANDAVVRVIDRDNPPSKPRNLEGKSAIAAYFEDVCGRGMTHKVENGVAVGNRLAFTQSCAYPDGTKVFCSAMVTPNCRAGLGWLNQQPARCRLRAAARNRTR